MSEISSLYLAPEVVQPGLSLPWSQTRRQVFSWWGSFQLQFLDILQSGKATLLKFEDNYSKFILLMSDFFLYFQDLFEWENIQFLSDFAFQQFQCHFIFYLARQFW